MAMKSIFEDELILPGVITEIVNDYIAGYDTSEFGTSFDLTLALHHYLILHSTFQE